MKAIKYFGLAALLIMSCSSFAYRQPVHMMLTDLAVDKSVLATDTLWRQWNLSSASLFSYIPTKNNFHANLQGGLTYKQLFNYGVDAEDTEEGIELQQFGWNRAFNHFYNPQNGEKLFVGPYSNSTSPVWALEMALGMGGVEIPQQQFSYADAQQYFYLAFSSSSADIRRLNMGKMFQSLGHVVHHIQDMAQPEHTRLDKHIDTPWIVAMESFWGADDSSIYEEYTDELINCGTEISPVTAYSISPIDPAAPTVKCPRIKSWGGDFTVRKVYLGGYPIPAFSTPVEYWRTGSNQGLAEFSSRNFITTDTPFSLAPVAYPCTRAPCAHPITPLIDRLQSNSADLPLPSGKANGAYVGTPASLESLLGTNLGKLDAYKNYKMNFIGLNTLDGFTQSPVNMSRMASLSVFSERLNRVGATFYDPSVMFSTNYFNLDQWMAELMPRAVAYSAGLINHFFRIKLSVSEYRVFEQLSKWDIKNQSNYNFTGRIHFFFDDKNQVRHFIAASNLISLDPGQSVRLPYLDVSLADNASTKFYAVAVEDNSFRAVAVTAFENINRNRTDESAENIDRSCGREKVQDPALAKHVHTFFTGSTPVSVWLTYNIATAPGTSHITGAFSVSKVLGGSTSQPIYTLQNPPSNKFSTIPLGQFSGELINVTVPVPLGGCPSGSICADRLDAYISCYH